MDRKQRQGSKKQDDKAVVQENSILNDKEFWNKLSSFLPEKKAKKNVTLRLSPEIIAFFKSQGEKGYTSKMISVLQSYYESHKKT